MDAAPTIDPAPDSAAEASARREVQDAAARNSGPSAKRFDFRHPVFLSSAEWRKVRMKVQEFVESTAALISTWLRVDAVLQLARLDTVNYGEFTAALPSPTHVTLFKIEPLRGVCLLEIRSALALASVDRLLGGPGRATSLERNLTEMEIALMDQFAQVLLEEWSKHWAAIQESRPEILGHENNPRFLQSSSVDCVMLALTLEARIGETEGQIQLAFPYSTVEPIVSKLTQSVPVAPPATAGAPSAGPKWNQKLDEVPLQVSVRWPAFRVHTRALMSLKPGEILELQKDEAERIELRIGNVVKFQGRLGTRENKWAVQITEVKK